MVLRQRGNVASALVGISRATSRLIRYGCQDLDFAAHTDNMSRYCRGQESRNRCCVVVGCSPSPRPSDFGPVDWTGRKRGPGLKIRLRHRNPGEEKCEQMQWRFLDNCRVMVGCPCFSLVSHVGAGVRRVPALTMLVLAFCFFLADGADRCTA